MRIDIDSGTGTYVIGHYAKCQHRLAVDLQKADEYILVQNNGHTFKISPDGEDSVTCEKYDRTVY